MTTDKAKNIAALKRQLKSTTNATLKNALTKKIERLKQELEVSKTPAKEIAMQVRKAMEDVNAMSKSDFNALIKKLAMKPEYSFLKGMTKQEIKDDLGREAKPVGWRFRGRNNFKKPTKSDIK
jgi:adenine-specific DNA methylase